MYFRIISSLKMSIKDNLKLAKSNATDDEINNALHLAQCDDIIAKLPDGVNTMLGTKGVYLQVVKDKDSDSEGNS